MAPIPKRKGKGRGKKTEETPAQSPAAAAAPEDDAQEMEASQQVFTQRDPVPSQSSSIQASPDVEVQEEESQVFGRTTPPATVATPSSDDESVPGEPSQVIQTKKRPKKKSAPSSQSQEAEDQPFVRRAEKIQLPEAVEEDLSDWLRQNPMLYDKCDPNYTETSKKDDLWEAKAKSLDPPLDKHQLKRWYTSIRTAMSRAKKGRPSGSGALPMTQRQRFQQRVFSWMTAHICEVTGRQVTTAKKSRGKGKSSAAGSEEEASSDVEEEGQGTPTSRPSLWTPLPPARAKKERGAPPKMSPPLHLQPARFLT